MWFADNPGRPDRHERTADSPRSAWIAPISRLLEVFGDVHGSCDSSFTSTPGFVATDEQPHWRNNGDAFPKDPRGTGHRREHSGTGFDPESQVFSLRATAQIAIVGCALRATPALLPRRRRRPQTQRVVGVNAVHERPAVAVGQLVDQPHPVADHRMRGVTPLLSRPPDNSASGKAVGVAGANERSSRIRYYAAPPRRARVK